MEVNNTTLAICKTTVVKNLEEECNKLAGGLLNFVDKDDTVWLSTDVFRELSSAIVTNIAKRSADETRD